MTLDASGNLLVGTTTTTATITGVVKLPTVGTSGFVKLGAGGQLSADTTTYVVSGGALGTPTSGTLTNCTFPTLNQNTTGNAATATSVIGTTTASVPTSALGTGTADSTTFLRGDRTFQVITVPVTSVATLTGAITAANLATQLSGQTMNIAGSSTSCSGNAATATNAGKSTNLASGVLGSTPYQSAADTTAFLAPNTTTTAKIKTQTGTGSVGAAPVWSTLSEILDFIGSAAQGDILYRGASSWARLGAGTSGQFLKTLGTGANPAWGNVTSGQWTKTTPVTLSGSSVDITGIPATVTEMVLILNNAYGPLYWSGLINLQLGDSGGIETTGYEGQYCTIDSSSTITLSATNAFFSIAWAGSSSSNGAICECSIRLVDSGANTWEIHSQGFDKAGSYMCHGAGKKSTSATLDRIRLLPAYGTFGGGTAQLWYK
jgi:hypothetical protein